MYKMTLLWQTRDASYPTSAALHGNLGTYLRLEAPPK
jgi:hypothetical protein